MTRPPNATNIMIHPTLNKQQTAHSFITSSWDLATRMEHHIEVKLLGFFNARNPVRCLENSKGKDQTPQKNTHQIGPTPTKDTTIDTEEK